MRLGGALGWACLAALPALGAASARPYLALDGSALCWVELLFLAIGALTILITAHLVAQHFRAMGWRALQVQFIRILLLPPVVCTVAILIVLWPHAEDCFEVLVAFYEAVAFHCFWNCMIVFIGGPQKVNQHLATTGSRFEFCRCCRTLGCLSSDPSIAMPSLSSYEWRIAQFCLFRPTCALVELALKRAQGPHSLAMLVTMVGLVSMLWAMATLLLLENRVLRDVLEGLAARNKFWSIKLVVLLIAVERIIIKLLAEATVWDYAPGRLEYDGWTRVVAMHRTLQFVILIEMLFLALPMFYRGYSVARNRSAFEVGARLHHVAREPATPRLVVGTLFGGPIDCLRFTWSVLLCDRRRPPPNVEEIRSPVAHPRSLTSLPALMLQGSRDSSHTMSSVQALSDLAPEAEAVNPLAMSPQAAEPAKEPPHRANEASGDAASSPVYLRFK